MIVRLVINAIYSAILYDYRRGGFLAHIFVELPASTLAENATLIYRRYYKIIKGWGLLSLYSVELAGSTVPDIGGLIYYVTSSYIGTAFLFHVLLDD